MLEKVGKKEEGSGKKDQGGWKKAEGFTRKVKSMEVKRKVNPSSIHHCLLYTILSGLWWSLSVCFIGLIKARPRAGTLP